MAAATAHTDSVLFTLPLQSYPHAPSTSPTIPLSVNEDPLFPGYSQPSHYVHRGMVVPLDSPHIQPSMQEIDYVNYYFDYVYSMQYRFAGPALKNTLYSVS